MFDFITDPIENALEVCDGILEGELPSKHQAARLIADGVSVYTIAQASGFAVETIQALIDD